MVLSSPSQWPREGSVNGVGDISKGVGRRGGGLPPLSRCLMIDGLACAPSEQLYVKLGLTERGKGQTIVAELT